MTITKVSDQSYSEVLVLCESTRCLMNCRAFYTLLERFCSRISETAPQYDEFLNRYFNDEGYIDLWRIPHLMLDAFNQNMKFHKVLECEVFRKTFHQFLTELYNFCLIECQTGLFVKPDPTSTQNTLNNLRIRHQFLNTLMDTFINVMENIDNYNKVGMKA